MKSIQRHLATVILAAAIAAAASPAQSVSAGVDGWTLYGLSGVQVNDLARRTFDGALAAGTDDGLFIRTSGNFYVFLPGLKINSIAIPETGSQPFYAGTGNGFAWSLDGSTWHLEYTGLPSPANLPTVAVDPTDASVVYAIVSSGGNSGLYKSTNAGLNWAKATTDISYLYCLAIDPADPSIMYAGTDGGVFKSIDGGASWAASGLEGEKIDALAIDPDMHNILYAAVRLLGVFKSGTSGRVWSEADSGITNTQHIRTLVVDPWNTDVVYAGGDTHDAYKTRDGGQSWSDLHSADLSDAVMDFILWDDPMNFNLYAATSDGVFLLEQTPDSFGKTVPGDFGYAPTSPLLVWQASAGAEEYTYCWDLVDNDICDPYGSGGWISAGGNTSVTLGGFSPGDTIFWQVAATNDNGTTYADGGNWHSFTVRNQTFADVPVDHPLWAYIEAFYNAGITSGCGVSPLIYCPDSPVNRAAMAVFLLRAKHGAGYAPPPAVHMFADLPVTGKEWQEAWVDQFFLEGITTGCGTGPLIYCPENPVTRAAMAVFILRTIEGPSYTPPPASHYFADLPVTGKEWMEPWVDEFYRRGITTGCGTGPLIFCPENPVKRQAMAAFIVRAFNIPLP
jgi:hypothetical protein